MIAIVAVSYGGSADIPKLLASLLKQTEPNWRLYIVDNSNSNIEAEALETIARTDVRVTVLSPDGNLGYLGGVRYGLTHISTNAKPRWTVICNADVHLKQASTLQAIHNYHKSPGETQSAVVAPSIVSKLTGRDQNPMLEKRPTAWRSRCMRIAFSHPVIIQVAILLSTAKDLLRSAAFAARESDQHTEKSSRRIYAPHGSFVILHESYFQSGGDLCYPGFLFGEENYIAEQCRRRDLVITYAPDVVVEHREHAQTGIIRSRQLLKYMQESARLIYSWSS